MTGWGVWNYRARRKAQVSLLPCFADGYGAVPDAHLPHMHPNYLLDSQNAAAPGAHAALPRAALARNVLRAGERDARRQVLRAAGLLDSSARLGQQEAGAHAPRREISGAGSSYHCAGPAPGQMCVPGAIPTQAIDLCTQYRHAVDNKSPNGGKSGAVHRNLRKKQK